MNKIIVALVVAGSMAACSPSGESQTAADSSIAIDTDPADTATMAENIVEFSMNDIDGNVRQLSEWQGKGRLVNFWATWCAPCRREIPLLKNTQDRYADDNVQVIGVAVDFVEEVQNYANEVQFNYPILVGQEEAMAAAESSGVDFLGLPFTMIVAPDGELLKTHIGEVHEAQIELIVDVFNGLDTGRLNIESARAELTKL